MRYGYGRVSAKDQSLARQLAALKAYAPDLDDDHIFTDKQSGKNFNRKQYMYSMVRAVMWWRCK